MGMQWKSATLPDAVSPFFIGPTKIVSLDFNGQINIEAYLGRPCRSEDESEDLPGAIVRSLLGIKEMDRLNYILRYDGKANSVRCCSFAVCVLLCSCAAVGADSFRHFALIGQCCCVGQ